MTGLKAATNSLTVSHSLKDGELLLNVLVCSGVIAQSVSLIEGLGTAAECVCSGVKADHTLSDKLKVGTLLQSFFGQYWSSRMPEWLIL